MYFRSFSDQSANPGITAAPGVRRDLREPHARAGRHAEEIDEDAIVEAGVLIDQNPHRFVVLQRLQNGPREILLPDEAIAGRRAAALHQRVDARIVERTHHHVHRRRHQRVREGAQLPVAQVRGGEQDALALLAARARSARSLRSGSTRGCCPCRWRGKRAKRHQHAGDGAEHAVDDAALLAGVSVRKRHREIAHRRRGAGAGWPDREAACKGAPAVRPAAAERSPGSGRPPAPSDTRAYCRLLDPPAAQHQVAVDRTPPPGPE